MQKKYYLNNRPVFLLGFMGSGKTHWGKLWAQALQIPFTDLDQQLEATEQMSIADVFEKKGEDYFREKESEALKKIPAQAAIVSCGGGAPCFHNNISWMNAQGLTVFLEATPRFLLGNIKKEPQIRPLLNNMNEAEMLFFIETKLQERIPFYGQAQIVINAEQATQNSLGSIITL